MVGKGGTLMLTIRSHTTITTICNRFASNTDWRALALVAIGMLLVSRAAVAIDCGETLTGEINPPGETDLQPFEADAGEVVAIAVQASAGSSIEPVIKLFGPTGQVPLDNGSTNYCGPGVCFFGPLPASGIYEVRVNDSGLNETGLYDITLQPVSETLNGMVCGGTEISCGQTLPGVIDVSADSDAFRFDALSGEVVGLTYARSSGSGAVPTIKLFGPTGAPVPLNGSTNYCGPSVYAGYTCVSSALPDSGIYTVVVWDYGLNQIGPYDITLQPLSETLNGALCGSTEFPCGDTLPGVIDAFGDTDAFTFDAVGGEVVGLTYARSSGNGAIPTIKLFGPTGAPVPLNGSTDYCGPSVYAGYTCVSSALPDSGIYTVVVWDAGLNQTGPYDLTLEALSGSMNGEPNGPPTASLACGTPDGTRTLFCGHTIGQTIDAWGDTDSYSFDSMLGEIVTLRTQASPGSGVEPIAKLFGPEGQVPLNGSLDYCAGQCKSDPIPAAGTHTLVVWDSGLNESGGYVTSSQRCEIPVRARDAYLHVESNDIPLEPDPIPIDLAARGIDPLGPIDLVRLGDFDDDGSLEDRSTELAGVFSRSDVLDVQSASHRLINDVVPIGTPPSGGVPALSAPTAPAGETTDIPEDFWISRPGQGELAPVGVEVPADATHLFIAAPDQRYGDNSDPEPADFRVMVVPEPGFGQGLLGSLIGLAALVRKRRGRAGDV